jgi:hypothetical protein
MPPSRVPPHDEASLLGMLRDRYSRPGNGGSGEYALLTHVRDDAGLKATTTLDAVAGNAVTPPAARLVVERLLAVRGGR